MKTNCCFSVPKLNIYMADLDM